ncbi:hypothetical protein ACFVIX_14655 [Bacillus subtilis]|uniref:hypothetical protein n=1 Tax=Bacillus sp. FSL K6-1560 TaxID=2975293 RepID=UPI003159708E
MHAYKFIRGDETFFILSDAPTSEVRRIISGGVGNAHYLAVNNAQCRFEGYHFQFTTDILGNAITVAI